jgi:hypothetical protein
MKKVIVLGLLAAAAFVAFVSFRIVSAGSNHPVSASETLGAAPTPRPTPAAVDAQAAKTRRQAASATPTADTSTEINFLSVCRFSHRGPDDPIVFPNMPGQSHSHDFFANTTTAADSTLDSLRAGGTTCRRTGDTAGYWVPALMVDGKPIAPVSVNAYYRTGGKDAASIQAPPAGLKIVAGNAKATGPQAGRVASFQCGQTMINSSTSVPMCPDANLHSLHLRVRFPDCWNGRDLDSTDHKSHMAYSVRGICPTDYPVAIAQLTLNVRYPTIGGAGVSLASGPFYTAHADFFNAWDQTQLESLVRDCINAKVHCGPRGS